MAGVFAFFLLSMAGIPLTSGFIGKWAVFTVALSAGAWPVVLVAILASVIAVFFYVRVIVLMFFAEPVGDGPSVTYPSVLTAATIAVACGRDAGARRRAGPGARPRRPCGRIHQVTTSSTSVRWRCPVDRRRRSRHRLRERMAEVEERC